MGLLEKCPSCGFESDETRCPRCNALKVIGCAGSCSACATKPAAEKADQKCGSTTGGGCCSDK